MRETNASSWFYYKNLKCGLKLDEKQYYLKKRTFLRNTVGSSEFSVLLYNSHCSPRIHCMEIDKVRNPIQPNDPGESIMFKCVGTLQVFFHRSKCLSFIIYGDFFALRIPACEKTMLINSIHLARVPCRAWLGGRN